MRVSIAAALLAGMVSAQSDKYTMWDSATNGALPTATNWAEQLQYIEDNFSGFSLERYEGIVTRDNYVLELWRVNQSGSPSTGEVVVLGHGANTNGLAWFDNGTQSIGYKLANAGYDVWVLNDRISGVSMVGHETLTEADALYWDMDFADVGMNDLPAAFDFATDNNDNASDWVFYVGHSTGTTSLLAGWSAEESYFNGKVLAAALLSPLIKFGDLGDDDDHDMYYAYYMQTCVDDLGWTHLDMNDDVIQSDGTVYNFVDQTWQDYAADPELAACLEQLEELTDFWPSKFQHPGYQKYDNHHADFKNELNSPTPLKQLIHFAQIHREGSPNQYNYLDVATNNAAYSVADGSFPAIDLNPSSRTASLKVVMGHKDKINREDDQEWIETNLTATYVDFLGSHKTTLQHQDMDWFDTEITAWLDGINPPAPSGPM